MHILDTERLRLRTLDVSDAPFYLALLNTDEFIANIGDRNVRTLAAAREAIRSGPVAMQARLGHSIYLVERKVDDAAIGICGLIKRDTLDDVDLGYAFLPQVFGLGYAREAAQAVLEHARRDIGLPRVVAITSPENLASSKVLTRIGMHFDKIVRLSATDPGTSLYGIAFPENSPKEP